ncbi:MAG: hypothetical protein K8T26_08685 [Lentisphaerae bacterium]|nr:hypothetical protein [Lentisphaerota bacterium]
MNTRHGKHITLSLISVVAILLSGCWSTGSRQLRNETPGSVDAKIIDGKTTKAEVAACFGGPKKIDFSQSDKEVWRYEFTYEQMEAQNLVNPLLQRNTGTKKELVILFEDTGVVKKHTFSDSPFETRSGLLK